MRFSRRQASQYYRLFPMLKNKPKDFYNYMRMEVSTFNYILEKIERSLRKNWTNFCTEPIEPEEKLVITLRFLATGKTYAALKFDFIMEKSTICQLVDDVLSAIWVKLGPLHIPKPNTDVLMDVAQDFYLHHDIPHCVGAVDVSHIRIKRPPNSKSDYWSYKKFYSITLQGVADAKCKFISIDAGGMGRLHDATTLRNSSVYRKLKSKEIAFPEPDELYNSRAICPYYLIGDSAYPLSENLLKPHLGENLVWWKRLYNERFSKARVTIECAFGRLKQKFQIFYTTIQLSPQKAAKVVNAACVMHNITIDRETAPTKISKICQNCDNGGRENDYEAVEVVFGGNGEKVRKIVTEFFIDNPTY